MSHCGTNYKFIKNIINDTGGQTERSRSLTAMRTDFDYAQSDNRYFNIFLLLTNVSLAV